MITKNNYCFAPETSGIYYLYSKRKKLIYIGKSTNIRKRLKQHYINYAETLNYILLGNKGHFPSNYMYAKPFEFFRFTIIKDIEDLHFIELEMIEEYKPKYNNTSQIFKLGYDKYKEKYGYLDLIKV